MTFKMTEVQSKALKSAIKVNRIISEIHGHEKGPTVVFFGGIHGNEVAGVFAIEKVLNNLLESKTAINGSIYGIAGNLQALGSNHRFIEKDLNRLWTFDHIYNAHENLRANEDNEQQDLLDLIEDIIFHNHPPFYFIDIHTTSSQSIPFITINDALINRKFSELFPLPVVLGIEEYLEGPLLSYINELGYVSLGIEVGQHDSIESIHNAEACIYLALTYAVSLKEDDCNHFRLYFNTLKESSQNNSSFFEVRYREAIALSDNFKMNGIFHSFQPVKRNDLLAFKNDIPVQAKKEGYIFMPLYQKQGEEGFFIIQKINPLFLRFSSFLRKLKGYNVLVVLPGIKWKNKKRGILEVNLRIAKFFAKKIAHLLGFRAKKIQNNRMLMYNREKVARTKDYNKEKWFKK